MAPTLPTGAFQAIITKKVSNLFLEEVADSGETYIGIYEPAL